MKKLLLLNIFMVFGLAAATAQTYIPFPDHNTMWSELYRPNSDSNAYMRYFALKNGDTVINSVTYHKLYYSRDTVFEESEYVGGIREDGSKKVYFRGSFFWFSPSQEGLIYDFSVQAGDTLYANANNGANNWKIDMVVTSVDSVNTNGVYRRQIHLSPVNFPSYPSIWVDGIGNFVRGAMFSTGTFPNNGVWNELICQHQDNVLQWHHMNGWLVPTTNFPDCNFIIQSVPDIIRNGAVSAVVPNPVVGTSYIVFDDRANFDHLAVYDITGRKVLAMDVRNKKNATLDASVLRRGVYTYTLTGRFGERSAGKFIVQ